jgi:hypothetical protein
MLIRHYAPTLGKSRPDNMIQAVMLYANKSKKVERKFALWHGLPSKWSPNAASVSDSSTYGVLVCVNSMASVRWSSSREEQRAPRRFLSFPFLLFGPMACRTTFSDGQQDVRWTI